MTWLVNGCLMAGEWMLNGWLMGFDGDLWLVNGI